MTDLCVAEEYFQHLAASSDPNVRAAGRLVSDWPPPTAEQLVLLRRVFTTAFTTVTAKPMADAA